MVLHEFKELLVKTLAQLTLIIHFDNVHREDCLFCMPTDKIDVYFTYMQTWMRFYKLYFSCLPTKSQICMQQP